MKHNNNKAKNGREHKINEEIRAKVVFLINENGEKIGNLPTFEARNIAKEKGLDLVQITVNQDTPICKIMDYGKFCFLQKKNKQKEKKEVKLNEKKEIQLGASIEQHDFSIKLKKAIDFLNEGYKVSIILKLKGRQIAFPELAMELLQKVLDNVKDIAKVELGPKIEGKRGILLLSALPKT